MTEEKNLNLNQEIFQILINNSSESILAFDSGLKITFWNKTIEQKTGIKAEECMGKFVFDVLPQLSREEIRAKFTDTLQGKTPVSTNSSIFFPKATNTYMVYNARYFPIRNGQEIEGGLIIISDITENNFVKKQLDLLEQTLKATFESTPYDCWLLDAEGQFILQNNCSIQNFGDLKGKNFIELNNSEEFIESWRSDFKKLQKGESIIKELHLLVHEEEKYFHVIVTPIKQNNEVVAIVGLSIDITERTKNEYLRLKNEQELKTLLENSPDIIRVNLDLRITYINKTIGKISLNSPSFYIGKTFLDLGMSPRNCEIFENQIKSVIKGKSPMEFENDYHGGQGLLSFSSRIIPEFSSEGEVTSVLIITRETTGLEKVRNQLLENQKRLAGIMSNIPGAVFKCKFDHNWTMDFISEGIQQLSGYSSNELVNNTLISYQDLIHPEDRNRVREEVQLATDVQDTYLVEYRIQTKNGTIKWVWEQGKIVLNDDYSKALEGVIIDITERKDFEVALKKSESELKKTNAELETYIYKTSHDLRGPLASIIGLTMVAEMDLKDKQALHYIDLIKNRTERLNGTLTNLLDLVRVKQKILEPERIMAEELVDEIIETLKSKSGESIEFHKNLPFKELYYDPFILTKILHNLIENSIDFKQTIEPPRISISMSNEANGITLTIEDNGIGIREDVIEKIFTMFYRGHDKSTGSGLGLYIVKSSVEKVGGTIDVKSEPNKGSRFSVFLPCIDSSQREAIFQK